MNILLLTTVVVLFATTFAVSDDIKSAAPNRCGTEKFSREESYILNGYRTRYGEFPWLAVLNYRKKGQFGLKVKCSGMVISDRFILTAAHCLKFEDYKLVSVWLGVRKLSQVDGKDLANVQKFTAKLAMSHPDYNNKNGAHDIALLRLDRKIRFTEFVNPICLPSYQQPLPHNGTLLSVAGWGQPAFTGTQTNSDWKLKTEVPFYSIKECKKRYPFPIGDGQICLEGEWMKGTCWGDGGGPFMEAIHASPYITWYAVGIVSVNSRTCGFTDHPVLHTRVSAYVNWIAHTLDSVEYNVLV